MHPAAKEAGALVDKDIGDLREPRLARERDVEVVGLPLPQMLSDDLRVGGRVLKLHHEVILRQAELLHSLRAVELRLSIHGAPPLDAARLAHSNRRLLHLGVASWRWRRHKHGRELVDRLHDLLAVRPRRLVQPVDVELQILVVPEGGDVAQVVVGDVFAEHLHRRFVVLFEHIGGQEAVDLHLEAVGARWRRLFRCIQSSLQLLG